MTGLDQILFGFTREGGLGPLGVSGRGWDHADKWNARLHPFYRLNPTQLGGAPFVPRQTLSYLRFADGDAALLARFDDPADPGRNTAHALVGSATTLDTFAPFLFRWPGWIPEPGTADFRPIDIGEWHNLRMDALAAARADAPLLSRPTAALVRAVLAHEGVQFAPITDYDPLALLILVREVLEPVLADPGFGWTFTTYEKSDTTASASPHLNGAPLFWCLRGTDYGETARHRVDTRQRLVDDDFAHLAVDLVAEYTSAPNGYAALIEKTLRGVTGRRARIKRLQEREVPTAQAYGVHTELTTPIEPDPETPASGEPARAQDIDKVLREIRRSVLMIEERTLKDQRLVVVLLAVLIVLTVIGWVI